MVAFKMVVIIVITSSIYRHLSNYNYTHLLSIYCISAAILALNIYLCTLLFHQNRALLFVQCHPLVLIIAHILHFITCMVDNYLNYISDLRLHFTIMQYLHITYAYIAISAIFHIGSKLQKFASTFYLLTMIYRTQIQKYHGCILETKLHHLRSANDILYSQSLM